MALAIAYGIASMLRVSSKAKMVQSCIMHDLCHCTSTGLAFVNGMNVCVTTASMVRVSQTTLLSVLQVRDTLSK